MRAADASLVRVAARGDIPDDAGLCVTVDGRQIALFDADGEIVAIGNVCPHQGAPLANGFYEDGIVECPLHGWMFDVRTGRALNGTDPVRTFTVVVEGEDIFVRTDPPA